MSLMLNFDTMIMRDNPKDVNSFDEYSISTIYDHLRNRIDNITEDLVFIRSVIGNNPKAVSFFINEFSVSILRYITQNVLHLRSDYEHGEPYQIIVSDYFIFIAEPFDNIGNKKPGWHKLDLYRGDARLYSYVFRITYNHFIRNREKYINREKNVCDMLEYVDYETLLGYSWTDEEPDEELHNALQCIHEVFVTLNERDQVVLQHLVMDKEHWTDAFEELRIYLNPLGPNNEWEAWSYEEKQEAIDKYWTPKQKQDAMASLKKRAIAHLASRIKKLKEKRNGKERNII